MSRYASRHTPAARCLFCKVNEASFDSESGGYFSTCERCFAIRAAAPACIAEGCLIGGHTERKSEAVDYRVEVAAAVYACEVCGWQGTAVEGAERHGVIAGERDLAYVAEQPSMAWLVPTRRESATKTLGFRPEFTAPSAFAYARGYLAATA